MVYFRYTGSILEVYFRYTNSILTVYGGNNFFPHNNVMVTPYYIINNKDQRIVAVVRKSRHYMLVLYSITIAVASISFLISLGAYIFYTQYDRDREKSRLLQLITLLILCDGLSSVCFVIWAILDFYETAKDGYLWCRIFLPFPTFFFLMGFGLMILIAHRFKEINQAHSEKRIRDLPLWVVPVVSLVCMLPIVISNWAGHGREVSELIQSSRDNHRQFCFFSSNRKSFAVTAVCFQAPVAFTVAYNIYAYVMGVHALRDSPHTVSDPPLPGGQCSNMSSDLCLTTAQVMQRQVRRARKHVFVQLIVWIPCICVNLYHSLWLSQRNEPYLLIQVLIILTSMQGILNSVAYMWGHRSFRRWVKTKLGCQSTDDCYVDDNETLLTTHACCDETTLQSALRGSDLQQQQLQQQVSWTSAGGYSRIESSEKAVRFGKQNDTLVYTEPEVYESDGEYDDASAEKTQADARRNHRSLSAAWRGRMRSLLRLGTV